MKVYEFCMFNRLDDSLEESRLYSDLDRAIEEANARADTYHEDLQFAWRLDENDTGEDVDLYDYDLGDNGYTARLRRNVGIEGYEKILEGSEFIVMEREVL